MNIGFLVTLLALVLLYRWRRRVFAARLHKERLEGLVIGVDIDGVLADQITEILRRVARRYDIHLSYDDVTDWRMPIANTNIADLIVEAMVDPGYVLDMRMHDGAWPLVRELYRHGRLYVITARPDSAGPTTQQWLGAKRIPRDGVIHTTEGRKHLYSLDVLVDDYLGNIEAFLEHSNGAAVLVDQPWNRDRARFEHYVTNKRLAIATKLEDVPSLVQSLKVGPRDVLLA
jgi:5'(3')-deoxyribonucleotidase